MRPKRILVVLCILAVAAVVLLAVLRPDPMGLFDRLDLDDVKWRVSWDPIIFTRYFDADIEAVRQAGTKALDELGYSPTEAGPATRPDGAQLEIEVSQTEDSRVALRLTAGARLELAGEPEESALKGHIEEAARLTEEFFRAVLRHLE